jgi:hypothetical protein
MFIVPDCFKFANAHYERFALKLEIPFYIKNNYVYWVKKGYSFSEEDREATYVETCLWDHVLTLWGINDPDTQIYDIDLSDKEIQNSLHGYTGDIIIAKLDDYLVDFGPLNQDFVKRSSEEDALNYKCIGKLYNINIYVSPFVCPTCFIKRDPDFSKLETKLLFGKSIEEFSAEEIKYIKRKQIPFGLETFD